jgi:D-alanyl-D-alanine carboxypeptidase/D-alanyl-D-alanine-endopeptidase (penicillin-binding protein 4)
MSVRIFLLFFVLALSVSAQENPGLLKIDNEIKKLSADPLLQHGQISFSLRNAGGKVISQHQGEKSLIPASNLKIITTGSALSLLGEDFTFQTRIEHDGFIKEGVLNGNIYITGGGDPTLGTSRYKEYPDMDNLLILFADKIRQAGIQKINGTIIPDDRIFEKNPIPDYWMWTDIGNYYGAGAGGLNINENLYKVYFKPGVSIGDSALVLRTSPEIPGIQFYNSVRTAAAGTGDKAYIYGAPYSNYRYMTGTIPMGGEFSVKGSLPDPSYLLCYSLYKALSALKVKLDFPVQTVVNTFKTERKIIYEHTSPPLKELVKQTNLSSINLYAEAIIKMIGYKINKSGSTYEGIKAVTDYWSKKGVDTLGFFLFDGSGLSATNAVSANHFSQILNIIAKEKYFQTFYNSLPVAGVSGTMAKICKGTCAENNIRAKTGTISNAICYSGYVNTKKGELMSFSLMVNNFEGTGPVIVQKMVKVMVLMADL